MLGHIGRQMLDEGFCLTIAGKKLVQDEPLGFEATCC